MQNGVRVGVWIRVRIALAIKLRLGIWLGFDYAAVFHSFLHSELYTCFTLVFHYRLLVMIADSKMGH